METCITRHVGLQSQDGTTYSGFLVGNKDTLGNGRWILQAWGNGDAFELSMEVFSLECVEQGFNVFCINGPGVGRSHGHATPESMGDAQNLGIRYLERVIKAKTIVIAGISLGGAAIGLAILQHQFILGTQYLVVRQMTFDQASNVALHVLAECASHYKDRVLSWANRIIPWAIHLLGLEMDSVKSSKKLNQERIREVIIQAGTKSMEFLDDGLIPKDASLGNALKKEGITTRKVFAYAVDGSHQFWDYSITFEEIQKWNDFLRKDEVGDGQLEERCYAD